MTTRDMDLVCEDLGIKWADYSAAEDSYSDAVVKYGTCDIPFELYPDIFSPAQLRAYIRWYDLDKRFPGIFTSDGMRKG